MHEQMMTITTTTREAHVETKKCRFDKIFITGCNESFQNDNTQCSPQWKFRQNDGIIGEFPLWYMFSSVLRDDIVHGRGDRACGGFFEKQGHVG